MSVHFAGPRVNGRHTMLCGKDGLDHDAREWTNEPIAFAAAAEAGDACAECASRRDESRPLHFADKMSYDRATGTYKYIATRCDERITTDMLYTDDVPSLLDAAGAECARCAKLVRKDQRADERAMRAEVAMEEGMLNGIESYNDWMGY